jgi:hypothetical protein
MLAIYHDSDSSPWKLAKKWEDLNPAEWSEVVPFAVTTPQPFLGTCRCFLFLMALHRYFKMASMTVLAILSGQ